MNQILFPEAVARFLVNVAQKHGKEFDPAQKAITVKMPIGNYYNCYVEPTCGLADENGDMMDNYDSPKAFFTP
jgi:Predicted transcriptional regulator